MKRDYGEILRELEYPNNLVLSIGNEREGHGPALYEDTDSFFAINVATDVAKKTGARYVGHIPYTTDRVGDIAKAWMPAYMPFDEFIVASLEFLRSIVFQYKELLEDRLKLIIVVGHGGIPKDLGKLIQKELEVHTTCVFPGIDFGMHAGDEEHSLLAYLKHFNYNGLDLIHKTAIEQEPEEVLRRWPPLFGLSGFWHESGIYSEDCKEDYRKPFKDLNFNDFQVLRRHAKEKRVEEFLWDGELYVDIMAGKKLYDRFLSKVERTIGG